MLIRKARAKDGEQIRQIHQCAFAEPEGHAVASLALRLLTEKSTPASMSLVAVIKGEVTGHISFSPVFLDAVEKWQGYILAPLGVHPQCQRKGIGSALVQTGIRMLQQRSVHVLFVYGDPAYYARFGFNAEAASKYLPPHTLTYPFGWQAIALPDSKLPEKSMTLACVQALNLPELW